MPLLGGGVAGVYTSDQNSGRLRKNRGLTVWLEGPIRGDWFGLGEGLVGQCAQERKAVALTNLPPGYLRIGSGLGSAAPVQAMALPLLLERPLLGCP